jgi:hypothetical protein
MFVGDTTEENKKPLKAWGYYGDVWNELKKKMDFK